MANSTPVQFEVPGIHCAACETAIAQAVHRVDPAASVAVDQATKHVVIGGGLESFEYMAAIEDAGYEVKALAG